MADKPFCLVKVLRITARHINLQYFGGKFLKTYQSLLNKGGRDSTDIFEIGAITFYHWFTALVSKTVVDSENDDNSQGGQEKKIRFFLVRDTWLLLKNDLLTAKINYYGNEKYLNFYLCFVKSFYG